MEGTSVSAPVSSSTGGASFGASSVTSNPQGTTGVVANNPYESSGSVAALKGFDSYIANANPNKAFLQQGQREIGGGYC